MKVKLLAREGDEKNMPREWEKRKFYKLWIQDWKRNLLQLKDPVDHYFTMDPSTFLDSPLESRLATIIQTDMTIEGKDALKKRLLKMRAPKISQTATT
mmetsp:Transcript_23165/g.32064  ORF Transcript_23165/g.32064 Transcript_23165/m.32064 type:complete len:98 (+) Transcript_23165:150-443(+)